MVKTRISSHARINRALLNTAIEIFGRTLTLRVVTRTIDTFGELSALTTADTTFTGDLQFGPDLDQKYLNMGLVEIGEAILYIHPGALSTLPKHGDQIVIGNSIWEIMDQIESPELGGAITHLMYRCRRLIETSDQD